MTRVQFLLWSLMGLCFGAQASSEFPVHYSGVNPFLIVVDDCDENNSDKAAGIYGPDHQGRFVPITLGRLLHGGIYRGTLGGMTSSQKSARLAGLVVVDGKIQIVVSPYTVPVDAEPHRGKITLGEGDATIVTMAGQPISLPPITSLANITVVPNSYDGFITFLVSIRHATHLGTGLTFAVVLKPCEGDDPYKIELVRKPVLVDDLFFDSVFALNSMTYNSRYAFSVSSSLAQLAQRSPDALIHSNVVTWEQKLKAACDEVLGAKYSLSGIKNLAWVDLHTGKPSFDKPPAASSGTGQSVHQVFDPFTGPVLKFSDAVFPGLIALKNENAFHVYVPSHDNRYLVTYFNSKLTLFGSTHSKAKKVELEAQPEAVLPEKFSVAITELKIKNLRHYVVIISKEDSKKAITKAYLVRQEGDSLLLKGSHEINDRFYNQAELSLRADKPIKAAPLLFDFLTPTFVDTDTYKSNRVATHAHLDVVASIKAKESVYGFLKPLQELKSGIGTYKKFSAEGIAKNVSRLEIKNGVSIEGELLQKGLANESMELSSLKFHDNRFLRLTTLAIDKNFKHGAEGFELVSIATAENRFGMGSAELDFAQIHVEMPFESLSLIKTFYKKNRRSEDVMIQVLGFSDFDPSDENAALFVIQKFTVQPNLKLDFKGSSQLRIPNFSMGSFDSRLKMDPDGGLYLVMDESINELDKNFKVHNLFSGSNIFPNKGQQNIAFLSQDELKKRLYPDDESHLKDWFTLFKTSQWQVRFAADFNGRFNFAPNADYKNIEAMFPALFEELSKLGQPSTVPSHQLVSLSPLHFDDIRNGILQKLSTSGSTFGLGGNVDLHIISALDGQDEYLRTLEAIREPSARINAKKHIILGFCGDVLAAGTPGIEAEEDGFSLIVPATNDEPQMSMIPPLMYLLATEGAKVDLPEFAKGIRVRPSVSIMIFCKEDDVKQILHDNAIALSMGAFSSFEINKRHLMSSWKVWPPTTISASKEIIAYANQAVSSTDKEVFPQLEQSLLSLADPQSPAKHQVLLVSKELKPLVNKIIFSRWAAANDNGIWNHANPNLSLYKFNLTELSQAEIKLNFEAMIDPKHGRRTVILAHLHEVISAGRPASRKNEKLFKIEDWLQADSNWRRDSHSSSDTTLLPHQLYWFATEGAQITAQQFFKGEHSAPQVSILLIGEPDEWEALERDMKLEAKVNLMEHFEVIKLETPEIKNRIELLAQVFARFGEPAQYKIDASRLAFDANRFKTRQEHHDAVLGYLVKKAEVYATTYGQEITASFIRILDAFSRTLVEDKRLRKKKVFGKPEADMLLTRVFPVPLEIDNLPSKDPYRILSDFDRAARALSSKGYSGSLELKQHLFRTLLAPTMGGTEKTRQIPGSVFIVGDTSSGITALFKTMMEVLDLKEYKYANPTDENANYMLINVGSITSEKQSASPGVMTIEEILKHVNNFLSLPYGYRGHILFDDLHKGNTTVVQELIKLIQSWFDADKGIISARRMDSAGTLGKTVEIPARNLHLWATLNPISDRKKLARLNPDIEKISDVDIIRVTLSSEQNPVEPSFLMRWGSIINLDKFPREAKAPALSRNLRYGAESLFNSGTLAFVSPSTVEFVVDKFPNSNAREFLTAAAGSLLQKASRRLDYSKPGNAKRLFVVVPVLEDRPRSNFVEVEASGRESAAIERFITNQTLALPIDSNVEAKVELLLMMLEHYRTLVYEAWLEDLNTDSPLRENRDDQLLPAIHAIKDNLDLRKKLFLADLDLDAADLASDRHSQSEIIELKNLYGRRRDFAVLERKRETGTKLVNRYLTPQSSTCKESSRNDVIQEIKRKASALLGDFMEKLFRIRSRENLPSPKKWTKGIGEVAASETLQLLGKDLTDLLLEFRYKMTCPGLVENQRRERYAELNPYDLTRIFSIIVDRAISQLPWGSVTALVVDGLGLLTDNLEVATTPAAHEYLFKSKLSPFQTASHETEHQYTEGSPIYKDWGHEIKARLTREFDEKTPYIFVEKAEEHHE